MKRTASFWVGLTLLLTLAAAPRPQAVDSTPPDHIVKLIFIHHSTGENWLADDYGGLGRALGQNNYFASDTNYGWGPNAIGDRTDIPNWPEWFASEQTPVYMQALFRESGQHSTYTRALADPGGENQIVLFKSCFPNSALEGNPNDPPGTAPELSVSGAKYVYNTILRYFSSRPDKLFIVITAPPLSDGTYAKNARAFNNWLVNDWLRENNYPLANVAVFDFYNILTDKNSHHRIQNGNIEHFSTTRNTLYYPSGDDHPSEKGSRKATEEFIPLLNYFYHRWQMTNPPPTAPEPASAPAAGTTPEVQPEASQASSVVDDFEGAPPSGTSGWESYFQDGMNTQLACAPASGQAHGGAQSLVFRFDVAANSWATCGFYFDQTQNWSAAHGIAFYLHAERAGIPFDVTLYGGTPGGRATYVFHAQTAAESVDGWTLVQVFWPQALRADWEENAGMPFEPAQVTGFAIGLAAPERERLNGMLWLDDLSLFGGEAVGMQPPVSTPPMEQAPAEETPAAPGLPCGGAALPFALAGLLLWMRGRATNFDHLRM